MVEIIQIRELLLQLLDRHAGEERLQAELGRARREFFGEERPAYARDEQSLELAAIRFAEWYLLERSSEQLGEVPVQLLMQAVESGEDIAADPELLSLLATSRAGVYITEATDESSVQVRDLQDGERLELRGIPESIDPGDMVIGRLFELGAGAWLPSLALAILPATPELAIAYQKDLRRLGLDRRLSQAELEHLLFRRWAENRQAAPVGPPLERLEAELESLLMAADLADEYPSAAISAALKGSPAPGPVIGPILEQLAFDSDLDLEALRRLMLQIWTCQNQAQDQNESSPEPSAPQRPQPARSPKRSRESTKDSKEQLGLGERIAARLDAGISGKENIEELFQDLAGMIGAGDLDDEDNEAEVIGSDAGDLEALVREFVWENNLSPADEVSLARFIDCQKDAPLPKNVVEYLEEDDVLRFLLQSWLSAAPDDRLGCLHAQATILDRFFAWVRETQCVELQALRGLLEHPLVRDAERLDAAGKALSTSDQAPVAKADEVELMRITQVLPDTLSLFIDRSSREVGAVIPAKASGHLQEEDLMLGRFEDRAGRVRLLGMVVVLPGKLQHLLG